jgi:hypothetical protein
LDAWDIILLHGFILLLLIIKILKKIIEFRRIKSSKK